MGWETINPRGDLEGMGILFGECNKKLAVLTCRESEKMHTINAKI